MSGVRRLLLDDSPGERRGVVLLDGLPERLLIERDGEVQPLAPGLRAVGRIRRIERGLGMAFVDLGVGEAVAPLGKGAAEGQRFEFEVVAPPRAGKAARVRAVGAGEGELGPLSDPTDLEARLRTFAPTAPVERGDLASEAAELAESAVLAQSHPLGGGASLSIELTRGLTAVDVDAGGTAGSDSRMVGAKLNRAAVFAAARLLRLKGLGGLVVFDLIGRGQDGEAVLQAARTAFAPDMPGVAYGPVSRLGVFHLALPWRSAPVAEQLVEPSGLATPRTVAQRLARALQREAKSAVRVRVVCAPEVAAAFEPIRPALLARLGPRFDIQADPAIGRETFETSSL